MLLQRKIQRKRNIDTQDPLTLPKKKKEYVYVYTHQFISTLNIMKGTCLYEEEKDTGRYITNYKSTVFSVMTKCDQSITSRQKATYS